MLTPTNPNKNLDAHLKQSIDNEEKRNQEISSIVDAPIELPELSSFDKLLSNPDVSHVLEEAETNAIPSNISSNELDRDIAAEAAANADARGYFLDSKNKEVPFDGSVYDKIEGNLLGTHQRVYATAIDDNDQSIGTGYLDKFNDKQRFKFLYSSYDGSKDEFILKEYIGTKAELKKANIDALNVFGPSANNDGFAESFTKGMMNTIFQTDDLVLGAAKGIKDIGLFSYNKVSDFITGGNSLQKSLQEEDGLDKIYRQTREDTEFSSYTPSKNSSTPGTMDWLGSGTGNAAGSLLQFGGVGRSLRAAGTILNGGAKLLSKRVLSQQVLSNVATYGASGLVSFGYSYNDAKDNGLSDLEALAFGTTVGGITSFLESKFGANAIMNSLTGASRRELSRDLIRELGGEVTEESLARATQKLLPKLMENISKISLKATGEEAFEEMAQTVAEQTGKVIANMLLDEEKSEGSGRFKDAAYNLTEIISAGLFGGLAAAPFSIYSSQQDATMQDYVLEGKSDDLRAGMDTLLANQKIDQTTYNKGLLRLEHLQNLHIKYKPTFNAIRASGYEHSAQIGRELVSTLDILNRVKQEKEALEQTLINNKRKVVNNELDRETSDTQETTLRKQIEQKEKLIDEANNKIGQFSDRSFLSERNKKITDFADNQSAEQRNSFAQYMPEAQKPLENLSPILGRSDKDDSGVAFRHINETVVGLRALADGQLEPEQQQKLEERLKIDLKKTGHFLSPRINTDENRPLLASLGIDEGLLPMTETEMASQDPAVFDPRAVSPFGMTDMRLQEIADYESTLKSDNSAEGKQRLKEYNKSTARGTGMREFYATRRLIESGRLTPQQLHSVNDLPKVLPLFSVVQQKALAEIADASGKPLSYHFIAATGKPKEARGFYSGKTGAVVLKFNLAKVQAGDSEARAHLDQLFNLIVHESTHSLFDSYLAKLFGQYQSVSKHVDKKEAKNVLGYRHFERLNKLAELAYAATKNNPDASQYFIRDISGRYFDLQQKAILDKTGLARQEFDQYRLTFVREFFGEAMSDPNFQRALDSFDLQAKVNEALVRSTYNYEPAGGLTKNTLLTQVYEALISVFDSLKGLISSNQATLLKEAFAMATTLDVHPYSESPDISLYIDPAQALENQDVASMYNPIDMFDRYDTLDLETLGYDLATKRHADGSLVLGIEGSKAIHEFSAKVSSVLQERILANGYQDGSLRVVHFKNTNHTLLTFKNEQGNQRVFINKQGNVVYNNTNVFNNTSLVSMAKHDVFQAFDASWIHHNRAETIRARQMLQNLDIANREDFSGPLQLTYDESHSFELNGMTYRGSVNVSYQTTDGQNVVIGYMPDLTKVRLAKLIKSGAIINVLVNKDNSGSGSLSLVARNGSGKITDVQRYQNGDSIPTGYKVERIAPRIELTYSTVTNLSANNPEVANPTDTFTIDDTEIQPLIAEYKPTAEERLKELGVNLDNFSFYDPSVFFDEQPIASRIDLAIEFIRRTLRKEIALFNLRGNEADLIENTRLKLAVTFSNIAKQRGDGTSYESEEERARTMEYVGQVQSELEAAGFVEELVKQSLIDHSHGVYRQKGQDWDGLGINPSNTISERIKFDLETIIFSHEGKRQLLEFEEAKGLLFDASAATSTFEEMVDNLKDLGSNDMYAARDRAIAKALYAYFTKQRFAKEKDVFDSARNSFWSQFASYKRTDAILFDQMGDSVRFMNASEGEEVRNAVRETTKKIRERLAQIKQEADAVGIKPLDYYYAKMNTFAGFSQLNKNGEAMPLITKINSDNSNLTDKRMGYTSAADNKYSEEEYQQIGERIIQYFQFLGVELPVSLITRKNISLLTSAEDINQRLADFKKERAEFYKQAIETRKQKPFATPEIVAQLRSRLLQNYTNDVEMERLRLAESLDEERYSYSAVYFSRKVSVMNPETKKMENKRQSPAYHPFLQLYAQMASEVGFSAKLALEKNAVFTDDLIKSDLKLLMEKTLQARGNYRSPEHYFDVNFNKRWAYKVKSFTDELFERLLKNKNNVLDTYLSQKIYSRNLVLKQIKSDQKKGIPQFEVASLSGLKAFEGYASNADYTGASDVDFMYMHLAGFVSVGNNSHYYHIDDVPSDKPNILSYKLRTLQASEFKESIKDIISTENEREQIAIDAFENAFIEVGADQYVISDAKRFSELVEGVHFEAIKQDRKVVQDARGNTIYKKGRIFSPKNRFYDGKSADQIMTQIKKESDQAYHEFVDKGLLVPVAQKFYARHPDEVMKKLRVDIFREKSSSQKQVLIERLQALEDSRNEDIQTYTEELEEERARLFEEWQFNHIINRYHLSQLQMGDYVFYKGGDEFSDLNKRKAGAAAPRQKGLWQRQKAKLVIIKDLEEDVTIPKMVYQQGKWTVSSNVDGDTIETNRTDAQGFVTEDFAQEMVNAYGSFAEYERIFKPVLFGVNQQYLSEARPLYLKLSLSVLPRPLTEMGVTDHYEKFPELLDFALKVYNSGSDIAVFNSGVKVGISNLNEYKAETYQSQEFDLDLFGLQNDPYHAIEGDATIAAGAQLEKQLADNGNFAEMVQYYTLATQILERDASNLFDNKLSTFDKVQDFLKDALSSKEHTKVLADSVEAGMRLDNPSVMDLFQNMINSAIYKVAASPRKPGDKLVNLSDVGITRESIEARDEYEGLPLQWTGPRQISQLTAKQRLVLDQRIAAGERVFPLDENGNLDESGYIIDQYDQPIIFPADVLAPEGTNYRIGDRVIMNRIPSSAMNSIIAGEVVGLLPSKMGNVTIVGKQGPAILGFDFDIDGLFTWRRPDGDAYRIPNQMFDIAFGILTQPKNYGDITTPVSTERLKKLADIFDPGKSAYSRFSPMRQVTLKKLNSVGKDMIGVTAKMYGVWSVLSQTRAQLVSSKNDARAYNYNGQLIQNFPIVDSEGNPVFESFVQFLNAATDNAKLQLLGKLNVNNTTASVIMNMISHGLPIDYVAYFVNQPIIKEFVAEKERQQSATYRGIKMSSSDIFKTITTRYEERARAIDPSYQYNPTYEAGHPLAGQSIRQDVIFKMVQESAVFEVHKEDRRIITLSGLKEAYEQRPINFINEKLPFTAEQQSALHHIDLQNAILEKFQYYSSLASITGAAGQLVGLSSSYPKTYLEMLDIKSKIDGVAGIAGSDGNRVGQKIDISNLLDEDLPGAHPQFVHQYKMLKRGLDLHANYSLYAKLPDMHKRIVGGKSMDLQKKVQEGFYAYVLSGSPLVSTKNFNGERLTPFGFVHQSARVVDKLKEDFPENEFLRFLSIKKSMSSEEEIRTETGDPSLISFTMLYDLTGEAMKRVYADFEALPGTLEDIHHPEFDALAYEEDLYAFEGEKIDVKRLLLSHLAFTKGFNLGGFSFGKILPPSATLKLDEAITQFEQNLPNEDLADFHKQVLFNNPELIEMVSTNMLAEVTNASMPHPDILQGAKQPGIIYRGAAKYVMAKGKVLQITFDRIENNKATLDLLALLAKNPVVNFHNRDREGNPVYKDGKAVKTLMEVAPEGIVKSKSGIVLSVTLIPSEFKNHKDIKQYAKGITQSLYRIEEEMPRLVNESVMSEMSMYSPEEPVEDDISMYDFDDSYRPSLSVENEIDQLNAFLFSKPIYDRLISGQLDFNTVLPSGLRDKDGVAYTYLTYAQEQHDKYTSDKKTLMGLNKAMEADADYLQKIGDKDLIDLYEKLLRNTHELAKKDFGRVFMVIGNHIGDRLTVKQLTDMALDPTLPQADINGFQLWLQSIADFNVEQAGMQRISIAVAERAKHNRFEYDYFSKTLQQKMSEVQKHYYAMNSKSWFAANGILTSSKAANAPFVWMYETRPGVNGMPVYTGRFINRFEKDGVTSSPEFVALELEVKNNPVDSPQAKLAAAKIALYDFIKANSDRYLTETGFENIPKTRALMPQVSMDVWEEYGRSGGFAFYMKLFGARYTTLYNDLDVPYKGEVKKFRDWKEQFTNADQSFAEKAKAPFELANVVRAANKLIASGNSGLSAMELKHIASSFATSSEIPFRSIAGKEDFSINTFRILDAHFKSLIFKKHHDSLIPKIQALKTMYQNRQQNKGLDYKNMVKYIDLYTDQYLFGKRDDWSDTAIGSALDRAASATVLIHMGLSASVPFYNLVTGTLFSWKSKMAVDGAAVGYRKMVAGYQRLMGGDGSSASVRWKDGKFLFSPLAMAVLDRYEIVQWAKGEVESQQDGLQKVQDFAMSLNLGSEIAVRGAAFLAELSEEQWKSFELDPNGIMQIKPDSAPPTMAQAVEWKYYIDNEQGKYSPEDRRNYSRFLIARHAFLFKGWILDFFQERYRFSWKDRYGKEREGYYITPFRLLGEYIGFLNGIKGKRKLTKVEQENIRKIYFDTTVLVLMLLLSGGGEDEDKEIKDCRMVLSKLVSQLYLAASPADILKIIKSPFPALYPIEKVLSAMKNLLSAQGADLVDDAIELTPFKNQARDIIEGLQQDE